MLLISSICLRGPDYSFTNNGSTINLLPGYYDVLIRGAMGGPNCDNLWGGLPAEINGRLHLVVDSTLQIVAGTSPRNPCAGDFPLAGPYGEGGNGGDDKGGAGGGYSSIKVNNQLVAMAGGGGGAGFERNGIKAGDYVVEEEYAPQFYYGDRYKIHWMKKVGRSTQHKGGNGKMHTWGWIGGSGGGGGYYAGSGGKRVQYLISTEPYKQVGMGGTSYLNKMYFTEHSILDGDATYQKYQRYLGNGNVEITKRTVCNTNCLDCSESDGEICTICRPDKYKFGTKCLNDCSDIGFPAYEAADHTCQKCMDHCQQCSNANTCTKCEPHYEFDGSRCIHKETQIEESQTQSPESQETIENVSTSITTTSQNNLNGGDGLKISPDDKQKEDQKFPWWIILVVGCVAVIAVVIVVVVYKRMKKEESVSMEDENVTTDCDRTTSVTVDNPLYIEQKSQQDPFKDDFEEGFSEGGVFNHGDIEEQEDYQV